MSCIPGLWVLWLGSWIIRCLIWSIISGRVGILLVVLVTWGCEIARLWFLEMIIPEWNLWLGITTRRHTVSCTSAHFGSIIVVVELVLVLSVVFLIHTSGWLPSQMIRPHTLLFHLLFDRAASIFYVWQIHWILGFQECRQIIFVVMILIIPLLLIIRSLCLLISKYHIPI